jgi:hypothetical protein
VAILFNNVGAAVAGGAAVTLLTIPAGAEAMALELKFTPVGGAANLTLTLERQATGVPFNFVTGHAIAAGDIFDFGKIALQEGDILSFSATGNDLNGLVSYYQDGTATTSAGSLNPRGEYSAPATYNRLDVVSYGGVSYIQLNDGITGDAPPSTNWMVNAAPTTHTHPIGEVAGLQAALDGKSTTGHGHGIGDVTGLQDALNAKAASNHTHDMATSAQGAKADAAMPKTGGTFTGGVTLKGVTETVVPLFGTTPVIDFALGTQFTLSTAGNTSFTVNNAVAGSSATIRVTAGGAHTLSWASVPNRKYPGGTVPDSPANGTTNTYVLETEDGTNFVLTLVQEGIA